MTPAELHEDLVETARWWAGVPLFSERARKWVAFFEQLPEDEPLLVVISGRHQDTHVFRDWSVREGFDVWNEFCTGLDGIIRPRDPEPPRPGSSSHGLIFRTPAADATAWCQRRRLCDGKEARRSHERLRPPVLLAGRIAVGLVADQDAAEVVAGLRVEDK
jgi:hypothetical protein